MKKTMEFNPIGFNVESFYCIKEETIAGQLVQHRFIVLIEDDTELNPDESCYVAYIREEFGDADYKMLFGILKEEISKPDFITLVKSAIYQGQYI